MLAISLLVSHFPALQSGADMSTPAFSTVAFLTFPRYPLQHFH